VGGRRPVEVARCRAGVPTIPEVTHTYPTGRRGTAARHPV